MKHANVMSDFILRASRASSLNKTITNTFVGRVNLRLLGQKQFLH